MPRIFLSLGISKFEECLIEASTTRSKTLTVMVYTDPETISIDCHSKQYSLSISNIFKYSKTIAISFIYGFSGDLKSMIDEINR